MSWLIYILLTLAAIPLLIIVCLAVLVAIASPVLDEELEE